MVGTRQCRASGLIQTHSLLICTQYYLDELVPVHNMGKPESHWSKTAAIIAVPVVALMWLVEMAIEMWVLRTGFQTTSVIGTILWVGGTTVLARSTVRTPRTRKGILAVVLITMCLTMVSLGLFASFILSVN